MDFSKYVSSFREPKSYSLGPAIRALTDQDRAQQGVDNQASQYAQTRSDTQNANAANYARDTATAKNDKAKSRYAKQQALIAQARAAAQSGHYDVARALVPSIIELGGEAQSDEEGNPFRFKEGTSPELVAPDIAGARRDIYGQRGPVPGLGAGADRNPMDPPALPGASAAALPPPPGAAPAPPADDPPPGAARSVAPPGAVWLPPGMDPGTATPPPEAPVAPTPEAPPAGTPQPASNLDQAAQSGQPGSEQPTGANPFQAPGLDPYIIDPEKVRQQNDARLQPFLGGLANAAGSRFKGRVEDINKYVSSLGLPPDESIKLTEKLYGEVFGLARSELQMEGQAGRAATTARHQESVQYDKDRDRGLRIAKERMNLYDLKGTRKKLEVSRGVEDLLKSAHRNGATANALIRQVYNMYASGVMTDNDYTDTKEGVSNLYQRVKNRTLQELNPHGGGLPPDVIDDMKELVEVALRGHRRVAAETADSLYRAYKANRNDAEREALRESFSAFPEEFLPAELNPQSSGGGTYEPTDEQSEMERLQSEEPGSQIDTTSHDPTDGPPPLGVAPLPKEPNRAGAVRGSRVPPKPPRKAAKDMTPEQRKARFKELLRKSREP